MVLMVIDALQPMEREIVNIVRAGGVVTASDVYDILIARGRATKRAAVRTRLAQLARMGVLVRDTPGSAGGATPTQTRWIVPK